MAGAEQRVLARDEASLLKRRAEVAGSLVRHDGARVVMSHEVLARDLVKRESVESFVPPSTPAGSEIDVDRPSDPVPTYKPIISVAVDVREIIADILKIEPDAPFE
jgi:hypothetical protein